MSQSGSFAVTWKRSSHHRDTPVATTMTKTKRVTGSAHSARTRAESVEPSGIVTVFTCEKSASGTAGQRATPWDASIVVEDLSFGRRDILELSSECRSHAGMGHGAAGVCTRELGNVLCREQPVNRGPGWAEIGLTALRALSDAGSAPARAPGRND